MASAAVASPETLRVLGASSTDQVHERWQRFLRSSREELQEKQSGWHECHRYVAPACNVSPAQKYSSSAEESVDVPLSQTGFLIDCLAAVLQDARACVQAAPAVYRRLSLFNEQHHEEGPLAGHPEVAQVLEFSEFLPGASELLKLLDRSATVAVNLLQQLSAIVKVASGKPRPALLRDARCIPTRPLMDAMGSLLLIAVTIDGLMLENPQLRQAFIAYRFLVRQATPEEGAEAVGALDLPNEVAQPLMLVLCDLEPFIEGDAFKHLLNRIAAEMVKKDTPSGLRDQISKYFAVKLEEAERAATSTAAARLELPGESLVPWVSIFVLSLRVWEPNKADKAILSGLLRLRRRSPMVVLHGRVAWCVSDFLAAYVPQGVLGSAVKEMAEMQDVRRRQATSLDEGKFVQEMREHRFAFARWCTKLAVAVQALDNGQVSQALLGSQATLLQGLALGLKIRALLEEYVVLHVREETPFPRSCVTCISMGFKLLKALEACMNTSRWAELHTLLQRYLLLDVQKNLEELQAKQNQQKRLDREVSEALDVSLVALHTCSSPSLSTSQQDRLFDVGALALCFTGQDMPGTNGAGQLFRELRAATCCQQQVARLCNTSWAYWMPRDLIQALLSDALRHPSRVAGLPWLCAAFAAPLSGGLLAEGSVLAKSYARDLLASISDCIIEPTCQTVEEELRLHTHGVMQGRLDLMPAEASAASAAILRLRPISLADGVLVDLQDAVQKRLSSTFYDLTALAPHDAEAYARMRLLAKERYGLQLLDGRLPAGSLAQGLDVIEIKRSIHLFVAQYSYNLHQQLFAQASNQGESKIHVICVEHLADSICRHGMGIMSTTVNYTYGFLKGKLEVVAEFLSDESVRSRLLADARWLETKRASEGGSYTWQRAIETLRFLRRLGEASDGVSFLDKLRLTITQIGNSLGYVRMVRAAGMRCAASSLPHLQMAVGHRAHGALVDEAAAAECPPPVLGAVGLAEEAMQTIRQSFEASTDYLHLLAQVFAGALSQLCSSPASPANLFYLLVPALSMSFIEAIFVGRESLSKRGMAAATSFKPGNALAFEDGFAVGIACILRVFGQEQAFQGLHWFEAAVPDTETGSQAGKARSGRDHDGEIGPGGAPALARQDLYSKEMSRLAATLEAACSLFGVDAAATGDVPAQPSHEDAGQAEGEDASPPEED